MCKISGHQLPLYEIGIHDAAELLGTSMDSIKKALKTGTIWGYKITDEGMTTLDYDRVCVRCHRVIGNLQCTVFCDTCRKENAARGEGLAAARTNRFGAANGEQKVKHKVPYEQKSPLSKVAWEARQAGMTYGQYMTKITARWF